VGGRNEPEIGKATYAGEIIRGMMAEAALTLFSVATL
jgi:hypothetical protein